LILLFVGGALGPSPHGAGAQPGAPITSIRADWLGTMPLGLADV
jgi:hypothetical protein